MVLRRLRSRPALTGIHPALGLALLLWLAALAGLLLGRASGTLPLLWPAETLLLAALLKRPWRDWPLSIALLPGAYGLAALVLGLAPAPVLTLALGHGLGIGIGAALVRRSLDRPVGFLEVSPFLVMFLLTGGIGAGLGTLAALPFHPALPSLWLLDWSATALGVLLILPLVLTRHDLGRTLARQPLDSALLLTLVLIVTLLAFSQPTLPAFLFDTQGSVQLPLPGLYPVILMLLWVALRLGVAGCALAGLLAALAACALTLAGYGPLFNLAGGDPVATMRLLQVFLTAAQLPALLLAIILAGRQAIWEDLARERERFEQIAATAPGAIAVMRLRPDGSSCFPYVSAGFRDIYGLGPEEVADSTAPAFARLHPDDIEPVRSSMQAAAQTLAPRMAQMRVIHPDKGTLWIEARSVPKREPDGSVLWYGFILDITQRKQAEEALFEAKERALVTLESIADGVITTDAAGRVESLNPVAIQLIGWPLELARGRPLPEVFAIFKEGTRTPVADPVARCLAEGRAVALDQHTVLRSRTGQEYAIEDSAAPIRDREGRVLGAVLVFRDVSQQRRLLQEIAHQAAHDALTGLVNRREFEQRLTRLVESMTAQGGQHALAYLDLDRFKIVNDSCGHAAGDDLLRQLALLFQARVRSRDTLARLGGDEFGVILEHCPLEQAEPVVQALRQGVEEFRFHWQGRTFQLGVSVGLVAIDATSPSVAAVLQAADAACYRAKGAGRNRVVVHCGQQCAKN